MSLASVWLRRGRSAEVVLRGGRGRRGAGGRLVLWLGPKEPHCVAGVSGGRGGSPAAVPEQWPVAGVCGWRSGTAAAQGRHAGGGQPGRAAGAAGPVRAGAGPGGGCRWCAGWRAGRGRYRREGGGPALRGGNRAIGC